MEELNPIQIEHADNAEYIAYQVLEEIIEGKIKLIEKAEA